VPGAIIGTPAALVHAKHWVDAKVDNLATGGNKTGADVDKTSPLSSVLPTAEGVDKLVFGATGTKPYEPTSIGGKLGQAAITGVGAGLLDPLALGGALKGAKGVGDVLLRLFKANAGQAGKVGLASTAAESAHEIAPDSDILPVAAALLTHSGAGLTADAARAGYGVLRPVLNPSGAAKTTAAKVLSGVDNDLPGLANPDDAAIQDAIDKTKQTTDALGDGLDDYTSGGNMRADLQGRKDALTAQRGEAADKAYTNFRAQPPMTVNRLQGFLTRPGFRSAMRDAGRDVLDEGGKPLTQYWDVEDAGALGGADNVPGIRIKASAIPPDVLDRIKGKLDDAVSAARPGSRGQRTAQILRNDFVGALDDFYPNSYPQTRADFAAASRPLDPLTQGPVGKVLDNQTSFGNRTYTMPQDRIADTFLKSRALRSDFDSLVAGYGGDKTAALGNLRENLVGKVQDAINPDGTLSQAAFDRSVKPYAKTLSMWFPDLARQFNTAKGAQGALDNLRAQEGVASSVKDGALRDGNGLVTQGSFSTWLDRNQKALAGTQDPNTVIRLKQIAAALPRAPGGGAEAAVEAVPAAVGAMYGGAEAGIFGAMFHKIPDWLTGPRIQTFKDAYSKAIEDAVVNPAAAKQLAAQINTRPRGQTPTQALGQIVLKRAKAAGAAAPMAVNASAVPSGQ